MCEYPEHDKMHKARADGSEAIGAFLEWLRSSEGAPYVLAEVETKRACENESWRFASYWGHSNWKCVDGRIMTGADYEIDDGICDNCDGNGWFKPENFNLLYASISINDMLARYFDIDLDKIEEEKRQMLDGIKEGNRET